MRISSVSYRCFIVLLPNYSHFKVNECPTKENCAELQSLPQSAFTVSLRHCGIGKKSDAPPQCRKDTAAGFPDGRLVFIFIRFWCSFIYAFGVHFSTLSSAR